MRNTNTKTIAEQKPLGVIDVVSAGLILVWRRPWTLIVPLVFDALIWFLPRLSLTQLVRPYANEMLSAAALSSDPQAAEEARAMLTKLIESFNLLGLVAATLNAITRVPSLLAVNAAEVQSPVTAWAWAVPLLSPLLMILLFIPFFMLGLLLVAFYFEWIAQGARPLETPNPSAASLRVARLWLRLILFSLLWVGFLLAAGLVLLGLQSVFGSPELAAFATLLVTVGLFWGFIYLFFVPSAMAVSDIGLIEGIKRGTLLFRAFFGSTLALVALTVFLERGLALIWDGLTVSALGAALGIAANAFIGTALLAASMVYYQDRLMLWERILARVKAKK